MNFLKNRKVEYDKSRNQEILNRLWTIIEDYPHLQIDPEDHEMLGIKAHLLESCDNGECRQFFVPWTESHLKKYPLDLDDEDTAQDIMPFLISRTRIETVVDGLVSEFDRYARKDERGDSVPLRDMTGWKAQSGHPFGRHVDTLHAPSRVWWLIFTTYWVNSRVPHVKFIVDTDMNDVSDRLLHTELRAIIAATTHGLAQEPLKRHMIIPVMVFSVFGEQHGRILTAYFDGGYLVIHKSNIHRFSGTNRDPFNLFLRYMAADINEQEDTTKYTLKKAQIVDKPG